MRAVILSQWYPPEKAALPYDIAQALFDRGHEVTVLTGFPNYPTGRIYEGWKQRPFLDRKSDEGLIRRVALYPSHDRSPLRRAGNYVSFSATSTIFGWQSIRAADVVYVYHPPLTASFGPWLSRSTGGSPFVLHVQDLWPDSVIESGLLQKRSVNTVSRVLAHACNSAYRRASAVVAIAPTMATMLASRGVPSHRLEVIPNWADESTFFPLNRGGKAARFFDFDKYFTVMFAGNLGDLQALDVAVKAAALVSDIPDFRLVLVGDGVALPALKELMTRVGANNVIFIPPQPLENMNEVTSEADVQLISLRDLPFLHGTIPSKVSAVLASGLPLIAAVAGDAAQVTQESGAGWICPPENAVALAETFRQAHATTPSDLALKGAAGRQYYEMHMSRRAGVQRMEEILSRVVEES